MIKNEKQYQNTKKHLEDFKEVLADYEKNGDKDDLLVILEMNAVKHRIRKMDEEMGEYINLKRGVQTTVVLNSWDDMPEVLIKTRIAKGLTQVALAEKVGLKEQQIQKYEATDYAGASMLRLQQVADALGIYTLPAIVQISVPHFDTDDIPAEVLQRGQQMLLEKKSFC